MRQSSTARPRPLPPGNANRRGGVRFGSHRRLSRTMSRKRSSHRSKTVTSISGLTRLVFEQVYRVLLRPKTKLERETADTIAFKFAEYLNNAESLLRNYHFRDTGMFYDPSFSVPYYAHKELTEFYRLLSEYTRSHRLPPETAKMIGSALAEVKENLENIKYSLR